MTNSINDTLVSNILNVDYRLKIDRVYMVGGAVNALSYAAVNDDNLGFEEIDSTDFVGWSSGNTELALSVPNIQASQSGDVFALSFADVSVSRILFSLGLASSRSVTILENVDWGLLAMEFGTDDAVTVL